MEPSPLGTVLALLLFALPALVPAVRSRLRAAPLTSTLSGAARLHHTVKCQMCGRYAPHDVNGWRFCDLCHAGVSPTRSTGHAA